MFFSVLLLCSTMSAPVRFLARFSTARAISSASLFSAAAPPAMGSEELSGSLPDPSLSSALRSSGWKSMTSAMTPAFTMELSTQATPVRVSHWLICAAMMMMPKPFKSWLARVSRVSLMS